MFLKNISLNEKSVLNNNNKCKYIIVFFIILVLFQFFPFFKYQNNYFFNQLFYAFVPLVIFEYIFFKSRTWYYSPNKSLKKYFFWVVDKNSLNKARLSSYGHVVYIDLFAMYAHTQGTRTHTHKTQLILTKTFIKTNLL